MSLRLLTPTPTRTEFPCSLVELHTTKHLDCPEYQGCLDTAADAGWDGWHCGRCGLRSAAIESPGPEPYVGGTMRRRPPHPSMNTGLAGQVFALFKEHDTWTADAVAKRLGIRHQQARDACRGLLYSDRVRRIAPGIYERCEE